MGNRLSRQESIQRVETSIRIMLVEAIELIGCINMPKSITSTKRSSETFTRIETSKMQLSAQWLIQTLKTWLPGLKRTSTREQWSTTWTSTREKIKALTPLNMKKLKQNWLSIQRLALQNLRLTTFVRLAMCHQQICRDRIIRFWTRKQSPPNSIKREQLRSTQTVVWCRSFHHRSQSTIHISKRQVSWRMKSRTSKKKSSKRSKSP